MRNNLSIEVKQAIVEALNQQVSTETISQQFGVSLSSIYRIKRLWEKGEDIIASKKNQVKDRYALSQWLLNAENAGKTNRELAKQWFLATGELLSSSTMGHYKRIIVVKKGETLSIETVVQAIKSIDPSRNPITLIDRLKDCQELGITFIQK